MDDNFNEVQVKTFEIKNEMKQIMPFNRAVDGKKVYDSVPPNGTFTIREDEMTADVQGKVRRGVFKIVGEV